MELPDHVYRTLVEVCDAYPWPVVKADEHFGEILNEVAYRHREEGWGLSRKTGGRHVESPVGPIAEDILQLPNGHHFDVFGAAAVGNPLRPGKAKSIGIINLRDRPWVAPVPHTLSWATSSGGAPPPGPTPTPPPVPTPAPVVVDLGPVLEKLSAIEARLVALEASVGATPDLGVLQAYVEAMGGAGPGGKAPNHVTDILTRIDGARADVAQLQSWLRSRSALRF